MKEVWKSVVLDRFSYPYQVSNLGRVRNKSGRILKPFLRGQRKGTYPCVDLYRYGTRIRIDVHRLVALHFVPNPKWKPEVNHLDCNKMNTVADNLEWCTRSENESHKYFMNSHVELGEAV